MKTLKDVPEKLRRGEVILNGRAVMAFLADFREDGAELVVEDIIDAACDGIGVRPTPPAFINANRAYLEELARVRRCTVNDLIGLRPDGRYWCEHRVAVRLAAWVSPRLQVAFDEALIQFAKDYMTRAFEWVDKRTIATITGVKPYNDMIDKYIETPPGKEDGLKFGVMHNAIQKPIQEAFGEPGQTSTFKELHKVNAAMDAYSTPMLETATLARVVSMANIVRKKISDLWTARDEATDNARKLAEVTKQLLSK